MNYEGYPRFGVPSAEPGVVGTKNSNDCFGGVGVDLREGNNTDCVDMIK